AQAVGRIGNYFNQELYGRHTTMPWGLKISGHPGLYHPTFLYELIFDLALAALLVWLGHHTKIKPPGLFALYVTGYSGFRIYEESLRIDYSQHFLGLRLNTFVASALTLLGLVWFIYTQRRKPASVTAEGPSSPDSPAADEASEADNPEAGGPEAAGEGTAATSPDADADVNPGTEEESATSLPDKTGRRA
ncbi:MAG TPA: prolipoprotein diacylglyceryl transferase family protein, partial [Streptosporangiaceae bacterium]